MHPAAYLTGITNRARLGRAVRRLRKEREMTQEQLAQASGVSRLCVRDLETGNRSVGSTNVIRILRSLDHELVIRPRRAAEPSDRSCAHLEDAE
ncbi:helix-turn-helix transcriptional regulator [Candidatus Poriferisodalis sp.]|uniref:helix-turn-helix transcriptional regulator n=1 Tax=Candidatus Poriferisodalis sp. TaxID=3101277 RepID=UPI003B021F41